MPRHEAAERARKLYGRRRVPGSHRKIMLVLLARPAPMGSYSLARAARTRQYGSVQLALAQMETRDWLDAFTDGDRRRCYQITPAGRAAIMNLLGLPSEG